MITLPQILAIPPKLIPLLTKTNEYRYFLAKGGRGGGKSQAVARICLWLGEKRKLRIVCGREVQNTIQESVYSLLCDIIREYHLDYEIMASKLTHRVSGSEISFRGFRQQGAVNIKGMEGVDLLWIDEAQALTKQTIDVLIPTIRDDNSKIYFTMNPHVHDDAIVEFLKDRSDCLTVNINYDENPHCTNALRREAEECKKKDMDDYEHIWLGKALTMTEDAVFAMDDLVDLSKDKYELRRHYGMRLGGFDIARYGDDKSAAVIIQQMGALNWEVVHVEEWGKTDLNTTTGRILQIHREHRCERSIIDEDGLGSGPLDSLRIGRGMEEFVGFRNINLGYDKNKDFANPRTVNAYKLLDLVKRKHIAMDDTKLMKELCTIRYTYDHQQRKVLVSKDKMRKDGIKSPNLADGLIMAVSMIGEVKEQQDTQYRVKTSYSREDNLFGLAGIR